MLINNAFIIFTRYIPESFHWLRINNRLEEAENILQQLCKANGNELPKSSLKPVEVNINTAKSSSIFKYRSVFIGVVVQCLIW